MMRLPLALTLSLMAAGAQAQSLPVFDDTRGFSIVGTADDGVILTSEGNTFYCEIDDAEGEAYLYFEVCLPILPPSQVRSYEAARVGAAEDEAAFLEALDAMPVVVFTPAIERTMRDRYDCAVPMSGDAEEKAFLRALAEAISAQTGYAGALSDETVEVVGEITESAAEVMIDQGRIILDREAQVARLADCP